VSESEVRPTREGIRLWEAAPWLVVAQDGRLYSRQFPGVDDRRQALRRLAGQESPRAVLGGDSQQLPISRVRAVEWVPQAKTVLVRRHWLRDPWRLVVAEEAAGERLFRGVAALLPGAGSPEAGRVGPQDLAMDPRLGLGVLLAFMGLIALFGGAIEGAGQAPLLGPTRRFVVFAELGETVGLAGVLAIGVIALAAGVFGLVHWYRNRPAKYVVRASRGPA
jgi:hypothetical protein